MPLVSVAPSRRRRFVPMALAAVLAVSGAVALTPSEPAAAAYPDTFNPFTASGGFTVYAREDASLGNDETEGSIAVGGVLTKPGGGQYTIIHVSAGTGDYTLPTVDGDPTRLLVDSYSQSSGGIMAITSAGTEEPSLQGDLKMVERDGPFQPFARADWVRLNTNPANVDQTPLIDATDQQYPASATPPASATGSGSIYTFDTSATAVADYVEANAEASYDQAAQCLDDVTDPVTGTGYHVDVAEDAGSRVVLAPLSADQPNVVDYDDIAGTGLLQFSSGPTPGIANPLVIRVAAGTTEVIGARADPQGAHSPYILWDLSALTGDVLVRAAEARIDGSIYAPEADVTVNASPLDGQIIGRTVATLGGEIHSFMFAGQIACAPSDDGTFRVQKDVTGIDPTDPLLDGVVFTVNYTAATPDGDLTGSLNLPATGEWVDAGERFPAGTAVTFAEITPPSVPGYDWGTPEIAPNPLIIGAGTTAQVTVTNTATAQLGTFSVSKSVVDDAGDPVDDLSGEVPVTWRAASGGEETGTGTIQVPLDGTPVSPDTDFPAGTLITLSEDLTGVTPPDGYDWGAAGWDPGRVIVVGDGTTAEITLTNLLIPDTAERTVSVVKEVTGHAADPRFQYAISYNADPDIPGTEQRRTQEIAVGDPITLLDLETGTDTLELAELVPLFDNAPVDVSAWDAPVFRVTIDGETQEFAAGGFEGDVPLADAIVEIPLPDSGEIVIDVVNNRKTGTFSLAKQFEGIDPADLPVGTAVNVSWTATDPLDNETTGTISLPVDGTPVTPRDAAGDPMQFPYDTVVTFDEEAPPAMRGVAWGDVAFDPAQLTIGAGDSATVAGTVINTATIATGTFRVAKELSGITADRLSADTVTVGYLAVPPAGDGSARTGTMAVPFDGTPVSPLDTDGVPVEFAIGTRIILAEVVPGDDVLPGNFRWGTPVWSPSPVITITADDTAVPTATVTNTAVEYARVSLTKTVVDEAGLAPADTEFTVDWWVDDEPQPALTLTAGETVASDQFLVGSILEATEPQPAAIPGATWQTPVWTIDGQELPIEDNGHVVVPVASHEETIAFELTNALASDAVAAFAVEKSVTGDGADAVSAGTEFAIEYSVDGAAPVDAAVGIDEPLTVDGLEPGATVRVREGDLPDIDDVTWGAPRWSAGDDTLTPDADGWVTVTLVAGETLTLALENTADADPTGELPVTGGVFHAGLPLTALALIALGVILVWRRRVQV
ncbi:DUF5979 domain-containing protein [Microbacterium invictum]|uniref:Choice-of-anchor A domain-containing protein n=1 Tax=Microbacterium invictum TaxID=515415 RepID=A0AA40SR28_9MICO|nr:MULTISPECIES: DUF5979 domain-containing protein [Microbacterium]MBB4140870.1 choice-of-anchor A domain-containing protein [Microbacterium invictum]